MLAIWHARLLLVAAGLMMHWRAKDLLVALLGLQDALFGGAACPEHLLRGRVRLICGGAGLDLHRFEVLWRLPVRELMIGCLLEYLLTVSLVVAETPLHERRIVLLIVEAGVLHHHLLLRQHSALDGAALGDAALRLGILPAQDILHRQGVRVGRRLLRKFLAARLLKPDLTERALLAVLWLGLLVRRVHPVLHHLLLAVGDERLGRWLLVDQPLFAGRVTGLLISFRVCESVVEVRIVHCLHILLFEIEVILARLAVRK